MSPTLFALALFFHDWKAASGGIADLAGRPMGPVDMESMFDTQTLTAAENRLRIRDLTSAISREFFQNNYRKGEALLQELKALKPQNSIDLYFDAILQFQKGNYAAAIYQLEDCVRKNPELDPAWNLLGYLYSRSGNQQKALAAFRKAIAFEPYHPVYRYNYARSLWLTGSHSTALEEVDRVLQLRDNMPEAYFLKGLILEDSKRDAEAIVQYRNAEDRGMGDEDFYVHFFKLGLKLDSSSDLLRILEKTRDSTSTDLVRMQAIVRMKAGEYFRALEYNRRLLANGHYLDEDLGRMGQLLCQSDKPVTAIRELKLEDRAVERVRSSYEACEVSAKKGPNVRDPIVQPAM